MARFETADTTSDSRDGRYPVLQGCFECDNPQAWGELFLVIQESAGPAIRYLVRRSGATDAEAEVVVAELLEELYFDDCRKLRTCCATSEATFRAWLRKTGVNFARDWLDRWTRARARERAARAKHAPPDRSGPDEAMIQGRLEEWEPLMAPKHFRRLLVLTGRKRLAQAVSARTERRWIRQLVSQYSAVFDDGQSKRRRAGIRQREMCTSDDI